MFLESHSYSQDNISSLASAYIKAVYVAKWDIHNQTSIKIKNQIVVLLSTLYKDILDWYLKNTLDKQKVTSFIQVVNHLMDAGILKAKQDMLWFLVEKNRPLTWNDNQEELVKAYIQSEIDKNIIQGKIEMDNVIDLFRQKCIEILLEWQKSSSNMLHMSHQRSMQRISKLKEVNTWLESQISTLSQENLWLKSEVTILKSDIEKKQKLIKQWYHSWRKLNTRVWELEKEKEWVMIQIQSIEAELAKKRRKLKWQSLSDKIQWILNVTKELQEQESTWQQWFVHQQKFDTIENWLRQEIHTLHNQLSTAKAILDEVNSELIEEQRKNQVLTTQDENIIIEIIKTQISDYFHFLYNCNEFINQSKQEELELSIKMTFYRAKILNIDIIENIDTILHDLKRNYMKSFPTEIDAVEWAITNLKNFIHMLQYGSKYIHTAIKQYVDISWE